MALWQTSWRMTLFSPWAGFWELPRARSGLASGLYLISWPSSEVVFLWHVICYADSCYYDVWWMTGLMADWAHVRNVVWRNWCTRRLVSDHFLFCDGLRASPSGHFCFGYLLKVAQLSLFIWFYSRNISFWCVPLHSHLSCTQEEAWQVPRQANMNACQRYFRCHEKACDALSLSSPIQFGSPEGRPRAIKMPSYDVLSWTRAEPFYRYSKRFILVSHAQFIRNPVVIPPLRSTLRGLVTPTLAKRPPYVSRTDEEKVHRDCPAAYVL